MSQEKSVLRSLYMAIEQAGLLRFSGKLLAGELRSARARRLVREWARLHEHELRSNWKKLKALQPRHQIAPLE